MITNSHSPAIHSATYSSASSQASESSQPEAAQKLKQNQKVEQALSQHIANHPVAKHTMKTLTNALASVFTEAHGEIKGWAEIIKAASQPIDSNHAGSGVISPCFEMVGQVGWNGPAIKSILQTGSLREQTTLFLNLLLSHEFQDLLKESTHNPDLHNKLANKVNLEVFSARAEDLYKMEGWPERLPESRDRVGEPTIYNAKPLLDAGRISKQELDYHKHNPINHPSNQERVGFNVPPIKDENVQVLRDYGKDVWQVNPDSEFAQKARAEHKPVIAGPSGTTSRMMVASQLIAPLCKQALGVEDDKSYAELVRFAAYAYLNQDEHHSMLEINLGAAPYGLDEQWDDTLYTHPFSSPIQGNGFKIDNSTIQHIINSTRESE